MAEKKIQALILKQQDYRENDGMMSVLSLEMGKVSFVCRGIRKMASKNAVSCMPFVLSELLFDYKENTSLFSLRSAQVLLSHHHIRDDLEKMSLAQLMCEIVDGCLQQGEADLTSSQQFYELLSTSLERLDSLSDHYLILCQFLATTLKIEGIEPCVDECVLCSSQQVQTISIDDGGFVCANCAKAVKATPLAVDTLRRFRLVNHGELEHFDILKKYGPWTKIDAELLIEFLILHSGLRLESWRFLDSLAS